MTDIKTDGEEEKTEEQKLKDSYNILYAKKLNQYHVASPFKLDRSSKLAFYDELKKEWSQHIEKSKEMPSQLAEPYEKDKKVEEPQQNVYTEEPTTDHKSTNRVLAMNGKDLYKKIYNQTLSDYRVKCAADLDENVRPMFNRQLKDAWTSALCAGGEVGKTILQQIRASDSRALMAWAAKDFMTLRNPVLEKSEIGEGIQFRVNCPKHRGFIIILLTPRDDYDIFAYTVRGTTLRVKKTVRGIYASDLVAAVDEIVG